MELFGQIWKWKFGLDIVRVQHEWPTPGRRSQNIRIALFVYVLNVVDHAATGRAPNMTLLTTVKATRISGS